MMKTLLEAHLLLPHFNSNVATPRRLNGGDVAFKSFLKLRKQNSRKVIAEESEGAINLPARVHVFLPITGHLQSWENKSRIFL